MHFIFVVIHVLLGIVFLKTGIEPYWQGGGGWDAGVLPLFVSFWFIFTGFGFYRKNIWLVSMPSLALAGCLALYLFIGFLDFFQAGFNMSPTDIQYFMAGLVVIGFLIAGELYAIWRFRSKKSGTE